MLTVSHLIDSFEAHYLVLLRTGQVEPKTVAWYQAQLTKLRKAAGSFPASELKAYHLVTVRFTYHFCRAVRALYKWAVEEELVPKDPFKKLAVPSCGQRSRTLTRAEMTRLYRSAYGPFRRFLFVAAHTCSRPGELRTLTWADVDLEKRLILLRKFKAQKRRRDKALVRPIPLDLVTTRLLANLARRERPAPTDPVFVSPRTGQQWTENALRCRMRLARKRARLDQAGAERVVCYTLRHTGATNHTRNGIRDNALARIMGHTSTRTTARYQHLDGSDLVNILDRSRKGPGSTDTPPGESQSA